MKARVCTTQQRMFYFHKTFMHINVKSVLCVYLYNISLNRIRRHFKCEQKIRYSRY